MKRFFLLFALLLFGVQTAFSTTYFKTYANGAESDSMLQGSQMAWEFDVSQPGGSAMISLYLDKDGSMTNTPDDVLLIQFEQTDGDTTGEEGPSDSSAVADGIVYSQMGIFGFAPGRYLFVVQDNQDESEAHAAVLIEAPAQVNVWVAGNVSREGVSGPDESLANLMIGMEPEGFEGEMWSGLTDQNGDYTINLPDDAVGREWSVSFMFENQIAGWLPDPDSYMADSLALGENEPFDFYLKPPGSYVYGSVFDEFDQLVELNDWGYLQNENMGDGSDFRIEDGHFLAPAFFDGSDTLDVPFRLSIWGQGLIPDYLVPNTWNDPHYGFTLSLGDSIEKNIYVIHTDTTITAIVTRDGQPLQNEVYQVQAYNDSLGQTRMETGQGGVTTLYVRKNNRFNVSLNLYDEDYPLPQGYIIEGQNWIDAWPGDTVSFNLIPSSSRLSGRISFRGNSADFFDPDQANVNAWQENTGANYDGRINPDSMNFSVFVPNGTFSVGFNSFNGDFLSMPVRYGQITVSDQEVDSLDFELNYAFAAIRVHLKNAPWYWDWWNISSAGEYPDIYEAGANANQDTTYFFKVCEGDWNIFPPDFGEAYQVVPSETLLTVSPDQDYYDVEFVCTELTGMADKPAIPKEFFVKQNYPNPFNPQTTIEFGLPAAAGVSVEIYDINGRKISTLISRKMNAGVHKINWNGAGHASGVYIYRVTSGKKTVTKRLLLIK